MKAVLSHIQRRKAALNTHLFFDWVASAEVPLERKLNFLPILANFSMGFRDVNRWVLRYPFPATPYEDGISIHTFGDETHSRLYLEDWRRLRLDEHLQWRASDTLWWLFAADANRVPRGQSSYFQSLAVADASDPLLRFAQSEVIEACGAVFFDHMSRIATELTQRIGVEYRYLGPYHLARETGHMDCEELFESTHIDDRRRDRAIELADIMFDLFIQMFDAFLDYAKTFAATGDPPRKGAPLASPALPRTPGTSEQEVERSIHSSQEPLQRLLTDRMAQTARHPFYLWLRTQEELSPSDVLRRFIPFWSMSIMGYRDLNANAIRIKDPTTALGHAVNRWTSELQSHNAVFLEDWYRLGLDEHLRWRASDTLEFLFLDPQMDPFRRNIVRFTEMAVANPAPLQRLWLIHALESTGKAFFEHVGAVARKCESLGAVRLDYLAGRCESRTGTILNGFKQAPMCPEDQQIAADMIETAFNAIDEELAITLDVALSDRLSRCKFIEPFSTHLPGPSPSARARSA